MPCALQKSNLTHDFWLQGSTCLSPVLLQVLSAYNLCFLTNLPVSLMSQFLKKEEAQQIFPRVHHRGGSHFPIACVIIPRRVATVEVAPLARRPACAPARTHDRGIRIKAQPRTPFSIRTPRTATRRERMRRGNGVTRFIYHLSTCERVGRKIAVGVCATGCKKCSFITLKRPLQFCAGY